MKLLLDTHIFIWWNGSVNLLPPQMRLLCEDPSNTLVLSVVSIWEMQIKNQLGKLMFDKPLPDLISGQQQMNGLELLPIKTTHIFALSALPMHHKDPFDRLLIAQARIEGLTFLTVDSAFAPYGVLLSTD